MEIQSIQLNHFIAPPIAKCFTQNTEEKKCCNFFKQETNCWCQPKILEEYIRRPEPM